MVHISVGVSVGIDALGQGMCEVVGAEVCELADRRIGRGWAGRAGERGFCTCKRID